ncbi:hypothetical protein [Deinococcus yavapaiensis]|uniref:Uncharacterized protein n=1 Tax=Deinococcus yavapaiensis KR-236 TaxID=694435 RepID=A0A318S722_9DEIO|nr:hypothetical protein [Deinococcus yavapaiensis]PYE52839.1 hypothetical protein DES52_1119 [Deinococcus yavapaiensis KR-236]
MNVEDALPELIELYEYKVADLLAGNEPRGGRRSIVALRDVLLGADIESTLMRRFRNTDRAWRSWMQQGTLPPPLPPEPESTDLDNWALQSDTPLDPEGHALVSLATALWRVRLDDELARIASEWRREKNLVTLRSMYALSLNLEAGRLTDDVPAEGDPLVSLGNVKVAHGMLSNLLDLLLAHDSPTQTSAAWLRSMMLELADNPFPSARHGGIALERAAERTQIRDALGRGVEVIVRLLPLQRGGSGEDPPALTRVLFARNPARRASAPDDASNQLVVRLAGAGEVVWQGQSIGWRPAGREWHLVVGGAAYPLRRSGDEVGVTRVPLDGRELRACYSGDYLLLDLESGDHTPLSHLLALGAAVATVLDARDDFLHLRLVRGAAQWLRDARVDASTIMPDSAQKYAVAAPEALIAFARKGVENLLTRAQRRAPQDVRRALVEAARILGAPEERATSLYTTLMDVQAGKEPRETREVQVPGEAIVVAYDGEPVTVNVMGRHITLRADYRGEVTSVMPGAPAVLLSDLWVYTLTTGGIVIARQGLRIGLTFQSAVPSR